MNTKAEVAPAPAVNVIRSSGPMPPEIAFREAEAELDRNFLMEYVDSMHVLREKGYSYREIAAWLAERGVDVDHNEVYRVYRSWVEGQGMGQVLQEDDARDAQEEAEGR